MGNVLAILESQASDAMEILENSNTTYKEAINSGLYDELSKPVTNKILSDMKQIKKVAEQVVDLVQVLRYTTSDPNFLQELKVANNMVVGALANSKAALGQMQKAISDANEKKKAGKEKRKEEEVHEPENEEEVHGLEKEDKEIGAIIAEINLKAWIAKVNLDLSHIACRKACASAFADNVFKDVAKQIISDMKETSIIAKHVRGRLPTLRDTIPSPNLYKDLHELEEKAVVAMVNSEVHLRLMREMVADAEKRKKAREEAAKEEEARVEEVRKKASNEPGNA